MKITESQLRRIIREEVKQMNEMMGPEVATAFGTVGNMDIDTLLMSVPLLSAAAAAAGLTIPVFKQKLKDLKDLKNRLSGNEYLPDDL